MSKYTTQIRYVIQNAVNNDNLPIYKQIDQGKSVIFDFDYPIWDVNYKNILERKIIAHYFMYEIGFETLGLFKLYLQNRLNEIMPYYNELYKTTVKEYDYLTDVNITETFKGNELTNNEYNSNFTSNIKNDQNVTSNGSGNDNTTSDQNTTTVASDFPQAEIGLTDYASGAQEYTGKQTDKRNFTNTSNEITDNTTNTTNKAQENTDIQKDNNYTKTISGKQGSMTFTEMILKYRESLLNIDMMIINDLYDLFMLVY